MQRKSIGRRRALSSAYSNAFENSNRYRIRNYGTVAEVDLSADADISSSLPNIASGMDTTEGLNPMRVPSSAGGKTLETASKLVKWLFPHSFSFRTNDRCYRWSSRESHDPHRHKQNQKHHQLHYYFQDDETNSNIMSEPQGSSQSPPALSPPSLPCDASDNIVQPLEIEESQRRQSRLLRSIRLSAVGIFIIAMTGVGIISLTDAYTNNNIQSNSHLSASAKISSRSSSRRENGNASHSLSKVQQPKAMEGSPEHESMIRQLRDEFHGWAKNHQREYSTKAEKEKRFHIWKENHFRTMDKNEAHGPCKLTGNDVFGSNHFKDLSPEEFQSKYLTGYSGPHTDQMPSNNRRQLRSDQHVSKKDILSILKKGASSQHRRAEPTKHISSNGLHDPSVLSESISRHEDVQERYLKHVQDAPKLSKTYYSAEEKSNQQLCVCGSSSSNYNSYNNYNSNGNYRRGRFLKAITEKMPKMGKTYYNRSEKQQVCGYSRTYYNTNQSSVDCSKYKLSDQRDQETSNEFEYSSQGCTWFDASCWLQSIFTPIYTSSSEKYYNNYNYPSSIDWRSMGAVTSVHSQGSCGACWAITAVETIESVNYIKTGTLYDLSETEVVICDTSCEMCDGGWPQNAYEYAMEHSGLPVDGTYSYDGDFLMTMTTVLSGDSDELTEDDLEQVYADTCPNSDDGSEDNNNDDSSTPRYGTITGYAYATDRCVCYTDGSGCDCDEQNEALAVMNVASYGPATVCLDAGTWQDYTGGIITADSGCSSEFLDMNHCVQTVGYAFMEVQGEGGNNNDSKSSESNDGGNTQLEGYWIIRNQWSSYWGMSGYAYVAMGSNTCGVLNDMTQVFMDS